MVSDEKIGLVFETVKESRGPGLFVEYQPANESMPFASLFLAYAEHQERVEDIVNRIRDEALEWFRRFPVPLVASAVDSDDYPIDVSESNDRRDLLVYLRAGEVVTEWGVLVISRCHPLIQVQIIYCGFTLQSATAPMTKDGKRLTRSSKNKDLAYE